MIRILLTAQLIKVPVAMKPRTISLVLPVAYLAEAHAGKTLQLRVLVFLAAYLFAVWVPLPTHLAEAQVTMEPQLMSLVLSFVHLAEVRAVKKFQLRVLVFLAAHLFVTKVQVAVELQLMTLVLPLVHLAEVHAAPKFHLTVSVLLPKQTEDDAPKVLLGRKV